MSVNALQSQPSIAWLTSGHEGYGIRRGITSLAAALQAMECPVRILALSPGPFVEECRELGLPVEQLDVGRPPGLGPGVSGKVGGLARLALYQNRAVKATVQALRQKPVDVLHFRWPTFVVIAGKAAKAVKIPCFWQMPNLIGSQYPFALNRRLYQFMCARHGVQPLANSRYTAGTLGDRPVRPIVMYMGADEARFDPQRVKPISRSSMGIAEDAIVLTIAARLTPLKGQNVVLRAMLSAELRERDLHLLLLGGPLESEYASEIRRIARDAGAEHRLHLVGLVSDPERYYATSDIVINSCVIAEAFGWTVVEAMMMGCPTLVHASGGPAETVIDGVTGWHVHEPTVQAFAAGLARAVGERSKWESMGQAARAQALDQYASVSVAKRYLEIVQASLPPSNAQA